MGTSTVLSAMEWRQLSRLPTTASGHICMPACKLHKHQRLSSGLSHLIKRVVWVHCGRRTSLSRLIVCSRELLTEKAADIEKTIAVKEHERERYDFDPTIFYENRFWNRRPDGIVINKYHRTLYIVDFKRSSDRNKDFLRVKEDETNEQHRSIIEALRAAAPEWTFEQINFVARRRGAVVEAW